MMGCKDVGPWAGRPRAQAMMKSDEVEAMLHLHALGWGLKRIASEFGCSKNTVRRYVAADGWMAYGRRAGGGRLEDQGTWLQERFLQHRGNAEVVRQDLLREQSIDVSLRTVERAVAPFRRLLTAEAKATVRFETPPGRQLQIDFGQLRVPIADERVRVFLFVATLGYSRRCYVAAFRHERQSSWFRGLEGAFRHFGGVTQEVLILPPPRFNRTFTQVPGLTHFDVNDDGFQDLLLLHQRNDDGPPDIIPWTGRYIQVLVNRGDLTFSDETRTWIGRQGYSRPQRTPDGSLLHGAATPVMRDINRDGCLDLVMTRSWAPVRRQTPLAYRNNGSGQFRRMAPVPFVGSDHYLGTSAMPADVNGDGLTDILFTAHDDRGRKVLVALVNTTRPRAVRCP